MLSWDATVLVEKEASYVGMWSSRGGGVNREEEEEALGVNAVGAIQVSLLPLHTTCSSTYEPVQVKAAA